MTKRTASPEDIHLARQSRLVGIVLVCTILGWMAAQWLGGRLGWETRFVFLFDMAAIAAFVWTLVVTWRIWRRRNVGPGSN